MSNVDTPEEIQRQMLHIRSEVRDDVESIVDRAEMLMDWHYYVARYPWVCVTAAAALGYMIVPRRQSAAKLDADAIAEALRKAGVTGKADGGTNRHGWIRAGLGLAGSLLLRQAMGLASQELSKFLENRNGGASADEGFGAEHESQR